jgi:hypothetical protein
LSMQTDYARLIGVNRHGALSARGAGPGKTPP